MNNSLYELIPSMSPDSLRTFLKTSNSFFDTHTKKNIGYDIRCKQQTGGKIDLINGYKPSLS